MNQKELKKEIDLGRLKNFYIFCSDDYFLKKTYRERIVKSGSFDLEVLDIEEENDLYRVLELANSTKLFTSSKRRVIYARLHYAISGITIDNKGNNIIILDPAKCKNTRHKNLVRFDEPNRDDIKKFIAYKVAQNRKKIESKAADFILQKFLKKDASSLNIFMDKVLLYDKDEDVITYEDVLKLDEGAQDINIFRLSGYILKKDKDSFFKEADGVLGILHPSAFIAILTNEIIKTVFVSCLKNKKPSEFGINIGYAQKYKEYFNLIGKKNLTSLLDILYDMDVMLKSANEKGFIEIFKARMFEWFNSP